MTAEVRDLFPGIRPSPSAYERCFNEGRLLFRRGGPLPPHPPEGVRPPPEYYVFYGYVFERGRKLIAEVTARRQREAVRNYIELGHDLPAAQ